MMALCHWWVIGLLKVPESPKILGLFEEDYCRVVKDKGLKMSHKDALRSRSRWQANAKREITLRRA